MEMLYNITNITTMNDMVQFVDRISMFGEITLFVLFVLSFILIKQRYSILESVASSSFFAFIISVIYYILGIVSYYYISLFAVLTASSILIMYIKE